MKHNVRFWRISEVLPGCFDGRLWFQTGLWQMLERGGLRSCLDALVGNRRLALHDDLLQFFVGEMAHVIVANVMILRGLAPAATGLEPEDGSRIRAFAPD